MTSGSRSATTAGTGSGAGWELTFALAFLDRNAGVAPPRTAAELVAAAEQLKEATGRPSVTLSLAEGDPAAVTVSEWIVSHGGDPLVLNDAGGADTGIVPPVVPPRK